MELLSIDIFSELGRRLAALGASGDIERAAANIAVDMLSPGALAVWLARYPALPASVPAYGARNVLVIMAGNIPFVGLQDLVCVLAAGHRAIVKPSSKDGGLMSWVVEQLLDIAPGLSVSRYDDGLPLQPDAVVAMGGDDAVRVFREKYAGIPVLLRGNRSSLAVLDGAETREQLAGFADDVLSFLGLGCRNVSLVFLPRGYDLAKLGNALAEREPAPGVKHRNNCRQARALLRMNGTPHVDCRSCLMVEKRDFSGDVSVLNYAFYGSLDEVTDWVAEHDAEIQCVAGCLPHPRAVGLGRTQRPSPGDYPDGRDTIKFLLSLYTDA